MPALYPDTRCPTCGGLHTLTCQDPDRHPHGTEYHYSCPVAGADVSFRPADAPQRVILAPASALPLRWTSDEPTRWPRDVTQPGSSGRLER
jgi:hypothetical protein